ncbi:hypothetical protein AAVH_18600 [Aphelenchoides avenae]|nr:hypothetical protein AAVH_18600 [Aphelenchus avenae]
MSDEDDEDGRYDLEARYAAQVGQSGRFNRGDVPVSNAVNRAIYEDEYDDTYDDREFAMDTAAAKVEDEQVTESVTRRTIPKPSEPDEPIGGKKTNQVRKDEPKRGGNGSQKGRGGPSGSGPQKAEPKRDGGGQKGHGGPRREPQRDGQNKEQRAEQKKEQKGGGQQQDHRKEAPASGSGNRSAPSGAPRQQPQPGQQGPKREWTASRPKPPVKKQNSGEKQPSQPPTQSTSGLSSGPPPGMESEKPEKKPQPPAKKPTVSSAGGSGSGAGPDQRQRQLKERNKGKDKQKGADRKARGGMF